MRERGGYVYTPYGRVPGCPECGVIACDTRPVLCEHGVTPGLDLIAHVDAYELARALTAVRPYKWGGLSSARPWCSPGWGT